VAAYQKYQCFAQDVAHKIHNLASDVLKVALTDNAPNLAHTGFAQIGEISALNGYAAGGNQALQASSGQTGGVYTLSLNDPATWIATGGVIGPFRYAVLYNDTAAGKPLIAAWDYGQSITLNASETFRADFSASALSIT